MKKLCRTITVILILSLLCSGYASATAKYTGLSSWAAEDVLALYSAGGVPEELMADFTSPITRAEFTCIIVRACEQLLGNTMEYTGSMTTDTVSSPYRTEIEKAALAGIVSGYGDGIFKPDNNIQRQEAAKLLYNLTSYLNRNPLLMDQNSGYADDVQVLAWARPYVYFVTDTGLMNGVGDGFDPSGSLTREQAMVIIWRLWSTLSTPSKYTVSPTSTYRALAVGVSDYAGYSQQLRFSRDAEKFSQHMEKVAAGTGTYTTSWVTNVLSDGLWAAMDSAFAQADDNDVSILLISCHGLDQWKSFNGEPLDVNSLILSDGSTNEAVTYGQVLYHLRAYKGTKIVLFGSCYSGVAVLYATEGDYIITACSSNQQSYGYSGDDTHSIFERGLINALGYGGSLEADFDLDGVVTYNELVRYLEYICANDPKATPASVQTNTTSNLVIATGLAA